MRNTIKVLTITEAERIDTARSVIITQRLKPLQRAGYELYGYPLRSKPPEGFPP